METEPKTLMAVVLEQRVWDRIRGVLDAVPLRYDKRNQAYVGEFLSVNEIAKRCKLSAYADQVHGVLLGRLQRGTPLETVRFLDGRTVWRSSHVMREDAERG